MIAGRPAAHFSPLLTSSRSLMLADTLLTGFSAVVIIALIVGLIYWRTRKH